MLDFDNTEKKGGCERSTTLQTFFSVICDNHHQQQQVYFYCRLKEIFTRNIIKNNTYSSWTTTITTGSKVLLSQTSLISNYNCNYPNFQNHFSLTGLSSVFFTLSLLSYAFMIRTAC